MVDAEEILVQIKSRVRDRGVVNYFNDFKKVGNKVSQT